MISKIKLAVGVLLLAGVVMGFFALRAHYIEVGAAAERARQDAETVQSLAEMIESHKGLVQAANLASLDMAAALQARRQADAQTTRSLKDALQKTSGDRVGCRFDADSLRHLDEARARSAAAASAGLRGAAPGTPGALGEHP